ncbi:cellulose synthase complex periplasmic endoglucanase BcsZ [Pseudomonas citronellolis]|uniref:cellulose synthase complex periplasmic endoglucanase BcsZ n=1 Tax=Pseudomonas citronellolis TaxID=53408 RepID=UPI0023E367A0|nr:cellulose synthase complex periplasmic endoglucanase BcsZ [Pseudomonas citronellolis]MDF3934423.1 cellulose synthase complex periplasmic endoglucanase BcsZ [Pseudomonas citronellolis]
MRGLALVLALWLLAPLASAACWPEWESFRGELMKPDGRVLDPSQGGISTSEGQAYAMFFALVANDRESFQHALGWAENNLAGGDLRKRLPAWKWGQDAKGAWRALDDNNASDADLWMAYALLEAGRLWAVTEYRVLAEQILWRVAAQTLRPLPGLGLMLLPGDRGFVSARGTRLNPSYLPPQILDRFAALAPVWADLARNSRTLLQRSAPHGLAPDWLLWKDDGKVASDPDSGTRGSYDAIRVYLWLGMLDPGSAQRAELLALYRPMLALTLAQGAPPEKVDIATGKGQGKGPAGFSAALLPLLAALDEKAGLQAQRERLAQSPPSGYYGRVLALFGQGWDQDRYRFDDKGRLMIRWDAPCAD